jgi:hypothetical protein
LAVRCSTSSSGVATTNAGGVPADSRSTWQLLFFSRIRSYTDLFTQVFGWAWSAAGGYMGMDTESSTELNWYGGVGGDFDGGALLTGTDTGWAHVSISHVVSTTTYRVGIRRLGVDTTHTFTVFNPTVEIAIDTSGGEFYWFLRSGSTDPVDTELCSIAVRTGANVLNDADTLTASTALSAPAGTNLSFLRFADAATAATNTGTSGAVWTAYGTLVDATDPDPSIGGGAVAAQPSRALAFAHNF